MGKVIRVTPEERERIIALARSGMSRNDIMRETGRGARKISEIVRDAGLKFDRAATQAATAAKVADAKARRAQLALHLIDDAAKLRAQIWQPHRYIDHGGRDYVRVTWTQDEPTPVDKLKLMQAAGTAIEKSLRLDEHDRDTGADGAKSMLGALTAGLDAAYRQLQHDEGEGAPGDGGD